MTPPPTKHPALPPHLLNDVRDDSAFDGKVKLPVLGIEGNNVKNGPVVGNRAADRSGLILSQKDVQDVNIFNAAQRIIARLLYDVHIPIPRVIQ